jgi:trehalose 6-phosphate phosphatase
VAARCGRFRCRNERHTGAVPVELATSEILEPLRADPVRAAVLFDIDGTLAPIVRHPSDAHVPEETRKLLIAIAKRYGIVACVSGRPASVARQIVAIGSIAYVGNHGCELLQPGVADVVVDRRVAAYAERVRAFAAAADTPTLQHLRVRLEDKGPIVAFHWRGAPDEAGARAAIAEIEHDAEAAGLATQRGRTSSTPLSIGTLLRRRRPAAGLYIGDDVSDIDAFRGLRKAVGDGAVCIAVNSEEAPPELLGDADAIVDGTAGVRAVLDELLR